MAKVLEFQLQHQSFQWIFRTDFLYDWLVGSPCSPRDSQEYSPTLQFKRINSRSQCLLILWLQSLSAVILEVKKIKSATVSTLAPSICYKVMGPDAMILVFWMLSFKPAFSLSSFTLIKRLFVLFHFLPLEWYHLHIWGYWYFSQESWFQLVIHTYGKYSCYHNSWLRRFFFESGKML